MPLPYCHSRREIDRSPEVFYCAHPRMHARDQLVRADVCKLCQYWREPPPASFRPFPPAPEPPLRAPCRHLGEQIATRDCPGCMGHVRVKVFLCRHPAHRQTTLPECRVCPDFAAAAPQRSSTADSTAG